jgi:hypothetical protein
VKLGEHLLQAGDFVALGLARLDFGKGAGKLSRHQAGKAVHLRIIGAIGIEAERQHAQGPALSRLGDRQQQHFAGRDRPLALRQARTGQRNAQGPADGRGLLLEEGQQRLRAVIGIGAGHGLGAIEQVDQAEGKIAPVFAQRLQRRRSHGVTAARADQGAGQIAKRAQAALADDALGLFRHHAHQALNRACAAIERAVGKGVIGFFGIAAALQQQQQRFVPGRHPVPHHRFKAAFHGIVDFGPHLAHRAPQSGGVLDAQGGAIGVVVEEVEIRPPAQPHLEARGQHHAQGDFQAFRPASRQPQRESRPVMSAHQRAHLAASRQKAFVVPQIRQRSPRPHLLFFERPGRVNADRDQKVPYCLMIWPSGRRTSPQPPFSGLLRSKGCLAASASSISMPQPGASLA